MLYLIQQIILCLLFTALIGAAVGWLLRGMGSSRHTDMVAAQWRAKVADIESRQEATAAPVAAAQRDAQYESLRQRLAESERDLATLRTAQTVRTQTDDDTAREELRETRIVCQQLQVRVAEQGTLKEQLEKRLQMAATEQTTLVDRLRELESRYAQLTQERQHAVDTVADLQKQLRARTATSQKGVTAQVPQPVQPAGEPDRTAQRTARAVHTAGNTAARQGADASKTGTSAVQRPHTQPKQVPGKTAAPPTPADARSRQGADAGKTDASAVQRPHTQPKAPGKTTAPPTPADTRTRQGADAGKTGASAVQRPHTPQPKQAPGKTAAPPTPADARTRQSGDTGQQSLPIADTTSPQATPKTYEPAWRLRAPDRTPDNLQAIYGVGPKLEQHMNELGIFYFRQIAAFEKPDILWLARHLQSFPGRILRDRWVEQARSLEKRRRAGQPI